MPDLDAIVETNRWERLADKALSDEIITRAEAQSILGSVDDELLSVLAAAFRVRRHTFGRKVKLNLLVNAKSGICPEDCGYCSQSAVATDPINRYPMLDPDVLLEGAREAWARKAGTYCIVASGRRPNRRDLDKVIAGVRAIKAELPMKICACLGLLSGDEARELKEAGVDRYNHNLNTSEDHYRSITTTHTYQDRLMTLDAVRRAGISPCSGLIAGMGESDEQLIDLAYALREVDADSIPINFLIPIAGTPLQASVPPDPRKCLKILALVRFICPKKEIRVAGGREFNLRSLQPLALYPANAIFLGDYLTTPGQAAEADYAMLADLGFEIEECALTNDWEDFLNLERKRREQSALIRTSRVFDRSGPNRVVHENRALLNFSSNDYLGLSLHPAVIDAAASGARRGAGSTASRLVVGTDHHYRRLEQKLAAFAHTEAALVFSSGYHANLGTITALVGSQDAIISDELNHASVIDAARLSRARIYRYAHCDVDRMIAALEQARRDGVRRILIATESVFSMDGDVAPLGAIVEAKHRFGAALVVDEAHADGVFGNNGAGYVAQLGLSDEIDLHVGTFGKAFGVFGAFVAGQSSWISQLENAARSFIFTTALPPSVIDAIEMALDLVQSSDDLRSKLHHNADLLRAGFVERGIDVSNSSTQIVPLVVGESEDALFLSKALEDFGVLAVAIRPPTVPQGAARLRFSLSALHGDEDIESALSAVDRGLAILRR